MFQVVLRVHAALLIGFGLGFLFVPRRVLEVYGGETSDVVVLAANAWAVFALMLTVVMWDASRRDMSSATPLLAALLGGNALLAVIAGAAQLDGTLNELGWINVALFAGFAITYALLLVKGTRSRSGVD